jgi:hypothetical protein
MVYRAVLPDGTVVAVKRAKKVVQCYPLSYYTLLLKLHIVHVLFHYIKFNCIHHQNMLFVRLYCTSFC